ncbi:MAG: hypothetical protein Q9170_006744 [Blastenia crenularia]
MPIIASTFQAIVWLAKTIARAFLLALYGIALFLVSMVTFSIIMVSAKHITVTIFTDHIARLTSKGLSEEDHVFFTTVVVAGFMLNAILVPVWMYGRAFWAHPTEIIIEHRVEANRRPRGWLNLNTGSISFGTT